jgi:hypothetical protein
VSLVTKIDADSRLRIPDEWREQFGPEQLVELVPCEDGMLVRPIRRASLTEVLRQKVTMVRPTHLDLSDLDMDEFGW